MTPAAIIQSAAADGVRLALTEAGALKTIGLSDSVQRWLPRLREHKAEIIQLLAAANDTAPPIRALRWLLHYADRDPVEVWFAPAVTHAEVLAAEPGAVAAEPVHERVGTRPATSGECDELLALVEAIYADDTEQDRQEAIGAALLDPAGALACYRAITAERGITAETLTPTGTTAAATGCKTCRHCTRPGRAYPGYCGGGRADLLPAYGEHHPLRKLPDDGGATCASYTLND